MLGLAMLLAMGLLVALLLATAGTAWFLTRPIRRTYASAISRGRPGEPGELRPLVDCPGPGASAWPRGFDAWSFAFRGVDLPVWRIPGDAPSGPIVILSHGWGDSRIGALARVQTLAMASRACILWDMPGHGDARGTCALGTREVDALRSLIGHIREIDGRADGASEDSTPLVLYGWSMGAGVSIAAAAGAARERGNAPRADAPLGVIAEAPYRHARTPAANVLRSMALPRWPSLDLALAMLGIEFGVGARWRGFDRAALARTLGCPLLVIHGEDDDVCPLDDARDIADAASNARGGRLVVVPRGTHLNLWSCPTPWSTPHAGEVLAFLRSASARPDVGP